MYKYRTSDNSRLILVATIEVIRSNKGKPKLLFENYAYLIKHQKITSIGIALKKGYPAPSNTTVNVHQATLNGEARTNNTMEGWNNRFVHIVGLKHSSLWILISELQKEDRVARGDIAKDDIGNPPQKRARKESKNLQKRLYNLC